MQIGKNAAMTKGCARYSEYPLGAAAGRRAKCCDGWRALPLAMLFALAALLACIAPDAALADEQEGAQPAWATASALKVAESAAAGEYAIETATTGEGKVTLRLDGGEPQASLQANTGDTVSIDAQPADGYYLAQVRYSTDGGETFTALPIGGSYTVESSNVLIVADFVSKVWDGTIDVTWFDAATYGSTDAAAGTTTGGSADATAGGSAGGSAGTTAGTTADATTGGSADDASSNEVQTDYYLTYPAQFAGLAALVNGIFNDYPTTPILKDGAEQVYKGKTGNASYLNGKTIVRPDVSEDGSNGLDTDHLYAQYSQTVRITSLERGKVVSDERVSTTAVVGDASAIRARFEHADKNANSQNLATTADYYTGSYDFSGKTVHVEADLDFGGKRDADGTWSTESPLFMPVGGQYCMLPDNGYSKLSASFCGVLDGGGHAFSNVYCERYANTEYGDSQSIGIVGRLGVHDDDDASIRPLNPTVRNICLESGLVSGRRCVGCIVGKTGKTSYNNLDGSMGAVIENCVNKASAYATDKKGLAGIVGASWNGGIVQNCANLGSISHVGTVGTGIPTGGIVGSNEITVRNCYSVGAIAAETDSYAMGIGTRNGDFSHYIDNCWWLTGTAAGGGYYGTLRGGGGTGGGSCTEFGPGTSHETLSADDLNGAATGVWVDAASDARAAGVNELNSESYPVLWYQVEDRPDCTLAIEQPEHGTITVRSPYGSGCAYASGATIPYATMLVVECVPDAGYAVRSYDANGEALEDDVIVMCADTTITAQLAEAKSATLNISKLVQASLVKSDDSFDLEVTKTGAALQDGAFVRVEDAAVNDGDTVYEGDVLKISATPKDGVVLEDADYEYLDSFDIMVGTTRVTSGVYTLTESDVASGSLTLKVTRDAALRSWYSVADVSWYTTHTDEDEYTISTIEQLAGVASLVSTGAANFEDKVIHLDADVSAVATDGTRTWLPIGRSSERSFKGTFDGGGHAVELTDFSVSNFCGLFGYVGAGGVVENVVVTGAATGGSYIGGVCGALERGVLRACVSRANVTSSGSYATDAGGICGYVDGGTLEDCVNEADVSGNSYVGGIAGSLCRDASGASNAVIRGCYVVGDVSGNQYVGGLAGRLQGPAEKYHTQVSNCYMAGQVTLGDSPAANPMAGTLFGSVYRYYDVSDTWWLADAGKASASASGDSSSGSSSGDSSAGSSSDSSSTGTSSAATEVTEACGAISQISSAKTSTLSVQSATEDQLREGLILAPDGLLVRNATASNDGFPLAPCTMGDALLVRFLDSDACQIDAVAVASGQPATFEREVAVPAPTATGHYVLTAWADADGNAVSLASITQNIDVTAQFAQKAHVVASTVDKAATYAAPGVMRHTCKECGFVSTSAIAKKTVTAKVSLTAKTKSTAKRKLTVRWKKQLGITGYQVYVKQGSKSRYVRVAGANKAKVVVKKLKSGKKCKVKIRAYVKESGKYYYGSWSKTKKVKIR